MSDVLTEMLTEDDAALLWGAMQVWLAASVVGEPDAPTLDRLKSLNDLAVSLRQDIIDRWGRQSTRRNVDHQYRATMGVPTRCAVVENGLACNLSPDVHTSGSGLQDVISANFLARREGITRTTVNQPSRRVRT